jgi:Sulfotransferase family
MIISHKYKFILFCNPKTGSTSLEKTLEPFQEGQEFNLGIRQSLNTKKNTALFPNKHMPPLLLKAWLPQEIWDSYFKFVFVRNPWDWVVSEWKYQFKYKKISVTSALKNPIPTLRYLKNYQQVKEFNNKTVFTPEDVDYLFAHLKRFFPVIPNSPGLYQSHYVFDINGEQIVDFVGRFENLQHDFEFIKEKLDLDISLPHLNSTNRGKYKSYFTPDSKHRVAHLWQRDIDNFNYQFDESKVLL